MSSPFDCGRAGARKVTRRTRTFRPNYLSFAGTYQCNLSCPHCSVPIERPDRLPIDVAVRFLEDAHAYGIDTLGFTGGEPFLYPEFLVAVTRRAAALGFRFDRIVTNGVWADDAKTLTKTLRAVRDAGFSGKIGISVDKFHGVRTAQLAEFCRAARKVFARDNVLSLNYATRAPDVGLEPVRALAAELDGVLEWSDWLGRYLLVSRDLTLTLNWNHLAPVERAEKLGGGWDGTWFVEDYCEGPGQALIVTPVGDVKPCCGFASDLDALTIGNIHRDRVATIVRRARKHPVVGTIFRQGLTALRDAALARNPSAFPGATSNHCFFCWYVLTQNLLAAPTEATPGRVSLPLAPDGPTSLVMAFDGKTVHLRRALSPDLPLDRCRVYRVSVSGPPALPLPPERLTWPEYQAWIDRTRAAGFALTTRELTPCRQ